MSTQPRHRRRAAVLIAAGTVLAVAVPSGTATAAPRRIRAAATGPVTYTYDALGRVSTVTDTTGATATYAYDAVGNITGITRTAAPAVGKRSKTSMVDVRQRPVVGEVTRTDSGRRLTITGRHLPADPGTARVKVGGVLATVLTASDTRLRVVLAPGTSSAGADLEVSTEAGATTRRLPGTPGPTREPDTPLSAPAGQTAVSGAVRDPEGRPLPGVGITVGEHRTETGPDGRFLLTGLESGHHELEIDGSHARGSDHGSYEHGVDLVKGRTTALRWITWLTPVDTTHAVRIPVRTTKRLVLTTPAVPGLEIHVPAGTRITDRRGRPVRSLSITRLDGRHLPFPGVTGPESSWTLQPGLSRVSGEGLSVVRTDATAVRPGSGRSGSGPAPTARLTELGRLGVARGSLCATSGYCPVPGGDALDGDVTAGSPVDLYTGLARLSRTDLAEPDTIPALLTRTHRQNDYGVRSFGMGQEDLFSVSLAQEGSDLYRVRLPGGISVPFARVSDGTFRATNTPTGFQNATLTENGWPNYTLTFRDGRVWTFGTYAAALTSQSDRDGNTLTVDRDYYSGRISQVTSPNGRWLAYTYGPCGGYTCVTQVRDQTGRTVKYAYDSDARLTGVTDPMKRVLKYTWSPCTGEITCTQIASVTNPGGIVQLRNTFDDNGRITRQQQADGSSYNFGYTFTNDGRVSATTVSDPRGAKRQVRFNAAGYSVRDTQGFGSPLEQLTTITRAPGTNLVTEVADALGRRTVSTYDADGHLLTRTAADGTTAAQRQTYTYEPVYGRLSSVTNAGGRRWSVGYDDENATQTVTDPLGHQQKTEFSEGLPVRRTDAVGQVTTTSYLDGQPVSTTDPLGRATTFYWDTAGRLARSTDATGRRTTYAYDVLNQRVRVVDPAGGSSATGYDANGNVVAHSDPLGRIVRTTYDAMNRPVSSVDALGRAEAFGYTGGGDLSATVDRNGLRTTYLHDLLGRPTFAGYRASSINGVTTYESTVTNSFDAGNRLTRVVDTGAPGNGTLAYTYDALDRLTGETGGPGTVGYSYDAANNRTGLTVPGQAATGYTYDAANRLTGVTRGPQSVALTYDDADRPLTVTLPGNLRRTYRYDDASRLAGIDYTVGTTARGGLAYTYDAAGRPLTVGGSLARTALPAAWSGATYDAANQLTRLGPTDLTYDLDGQLTGAGPTSYTWNARGQLTSAGTASYSYDPAGRRATRTIGASTVSFVYDGANLVQERTGAAISADLLTGPGLDQTYTRTGGGATSSFLTDRLGSTVALADSTGTPTTSYTYEPFGRATASGAASPNPLQFTGRENDPNGLQYNRARYYSPALHRFISTDPLGAAGSGDNLYAYAADAPTVLADRTGLAVGEACGEPASTAVPDNVGPAPDSRSVDLVWGGARVVVRGAGLLMPGGARDLTGAGSLIGLPVPLWAGYPAMSGENQIARRGRPVWEAFSEPTICRAPETPGLLSFGDALGLSGGQP